MTMEEKKEANRLYWYKNRSLIPDDWDDTRINESVQSIKIERVSMNESGFEDVWTKKMILLG